MPYTRIQGPFAETFQDNRWITHGARAGPNVGPRRSAPAELPYCLQEKRRWMQGGSHIRNFKPTMYIVRPHDGKRTGGAGRILDALSGEGPDVFVMKCGDKRTLMRDRPQRWQWSGWDLTEAEKDDRRRHDKDFRRKDLRKVRDWSLHTALARAARPKYNFQSRKYESDYQFSWQPRAAWWTDARWQEGARRSDPEPLSFRTGNWEWYTRVPPSSGRYAGGRPRER